MSAKGILVFVCALFLVALTNPFALARKWTDSTGKYAVEAKFVDFKKGTVQLRKEDGTLIRIALEKLSEADQEFVQKSGASGKAEHMAKEFAVDLGGGVMMEMVVIPAGSFMMGDDKSAHDDEKPVHKVNITKPFYLGKYEVT